MLSEMTVESGDVVQTNNWNAFEFQTIVDPEGNRATINIADVRKGNRKLDCFVVMEDGSVRDVQPSEPVILDRCGQRLTVIAMTKSGVRSVLLSLVESEIVTSIEAFDPPERVPSLV